jgi:nicotinamidase-related amidase
VDDSLPGLDPRRTALLVMDYQGGITGRLPDADALVARTAQAIESTRRAGAHVGYVRVAFEAADVAAFPAGNKMAAPVAAAGDAMRADSPATAIVEALAPRPGDIVVRKTRIGPFLTTDLDRQLRERGITTLLLAGLSTSGVVLSTVRDGADRDYQLFVLADACADPEPDVHEFLMTRIFPRQADVIQTGDLPALFQSESPSKS